MSKKEVRTILKITVSPQEGVLTRVNGNVAEIANATLNAISGIYKALRDDSKFSAEIFRGVLTGVFSDPDVDLFDSDADEKHKAASTLADKIKYLFKPDDEEEEDADNE